MRQYLRDWSPALNREMEVLRFGEQGPVLLAFPTSMGRFYQWEDFGLIGSLSDRIDRGEFQIWCIDSVDEESWYAEHKPPPERVRRHLDYERYLVDEVIPRLPAKPVAVGMSFGALHALLLALRHPWSVDGFIGLSGSYDAARWLDGYGEGEAYFVSPFAFLPNLEDDAYLAPLRAMPVKVIATGEDDANVNDSRHAAELLRAKDIAVRFDVWQGWAHDWPYWKEMLHRYV
ncbi:MAG TPA: esterase [Actinobacteria bacterium]|jgi:esterase/lipase superfamily enzyme|nr:esterase [Actinomycetota bacterium]